jgi:hypothetical protein
VDDLTCTIIGGSTDLDGDPIDYTYTWYDPTGTDVQVLANTSTMFDTFAGTSTTPGLWECDVVASDGTDTANASADIEVDSDWAGALTFTNCGQTGRSGPSQSQCDSEYAGTTLDGLVTVNAGFQTWTVSDDGIYSITAAGASGGYTPNASGGQGRAITVEVALTAGDSLVITTGQEGGRAEFSTGYCGGGGGGTFVVNQTTGSAILIGGGGGGAGQGNSSYNATLNGVDASNYNIENGTDGTGYSGSWDSIGTGGSAGTGGTANMGGSGGGGYTGNGQEGTYGGNIGTGYSNGAFGGANRTLCGSMTVDIPGGFGGGAGAGVCSNYEANGGGGGGYSGGGGSNTRVGSGGGGGNFYTGVYVSSSLNTGHGYVTIDKL